MGIGSHDIICASKMQNIYTAEALPMRFSASVGTAYVISLEIDSDTHAGHLITFSDIM